MLLIAAQATADVEAPGAAPGSPPSSLPCTSGSSRAGVPVVVVVAPESPWAVVQLHVRVAGEGIAQELRAHTEALAAALAEGRSHPTRPGARARVAAAHGETRIHVDEDAFVISDGVPAAALDVALRALDERLAARRRLLPAGGPPPPPLERAARVPLPVRQALAPAHPYAQPLSLEGPPDPAQIGALADLVLRRDGVVVVVIGPDPEPRLRARVLRALRTTLPPGAKPTVPLTPGPGDRVVEGVHLPEGPRGLFSWLWWQTPGRAFAAPSERAAYRALAALLGAEAGQGEAAGWISWHVPITSEPAAEALEQARIERLEAVAAGKRSDEDVKAAAARARTALLRELSAPAALARVLGAEALSGKACSLDAELAALQLVTPDAVQAAAAALLARGRLVVRGSGPALAGGS